MENANPTQYSTPAPSPFPFNWLGGLLAVLAVCGTAYWYYARSASSVETKYAYTTDHHFDDPQVFFGGTGLRFEILRSDTRQLRVHVPGQQLDQPKYLLAEDGELDYLGFVKKDELLIPLELYQIHNARPGVQKAPVSDCVTYIEVAATGDTILVMVDNQYLLRGKKVAPGRYSIPFCETTREHQFRLIGAQNDLAMKGIAPQMFSVGSGSGQPPSTYNFAYQLRYSGDTIRRTGSPAMYNSPSATEMLALREIDEVATTKVTLSLPRALESPWVYVNDKRFKDFTLNSARNKVTFTVPQSKKAVTVRAGDRNCECTASGYPLHSTLELAGHCDCRDFQVTVNLAPGVDRLRNKIRIYIDGQLTDLSLPPAGKPFTFPVRKTDRNQWVELKMLVVDDNGKAALIDVCNFTVPTEATTVNLNPACHCADCPPNFKVSG